MLIPRLYLIIGTVVAAAGAIGFMFYQHNRIENLEEENAVLEADIAGKDSVIDRQKAGIAAMVEAAKTSATALKDAGDRIDSLSTVLIRERAKRNAKVETDYVLPKCAALLATDLADVCPAHAQRLRDTATNR